MIKRRWRDDWPMWIGAVWLFAAVFAVLYFTARP